MVSRSSPTPLAAGVHLLVLKPGGHLDRSRGGTTRAGTLLVSMAFTAGTNLASGPSAKLGPIFQGVRSMTSTSLGARASAPLVAVFTAVLLACSVVSLGASHVPQRVTANQIDPGGGGGGGIGPGGNPCHGGRCP